MRLAGKLLHDGSTATVIVEAGRIASIRHGIEPDALGGPDVWLAPGFHDLQINGYAGKDFNAGSWGLGEASEDEGEQFAELQRSLARHGTALFCPTIVTDSVEQMEINLRRIARAVAQNARLRKAVTGIHLEGPFLSPEDGPRGAHPLDYVQPPSRDLFLRFQDAAAGLIRMCTLAPELPGALAFIEWLAANGVVAAIGHTGASSAVIRDAVSAGATVSTHIGNGCHARIPRHDSYIWEQLACDRLIATMIIDGHHIEPSEARVMVRAKGPKRTELISDAVKLGGMPPGTYADGKFEVKPDGRIVLAGTPYLAGASALLDTCIANAWRWTDMDLAEAVACATETPARALQLKGKGRIEVGYDADMTLFRVGDEGPLGIVATILGGERIDASADPSDASDLSDPSDLSEKI